MSGGSEKEKPNEAKEEKRRKKLTHEASTVRAPPGLSIAHRKMKKKTEVRLKSEEEMKLRDRDERRGRRRRLVTVGGAAVLWPPDSEGEK